MASSEAIRNRNINKLLKNENNLNVGQTNSKNDLDEKLKNLAKNEKENLHAYHLKKYEDEAANLKADKNSYYLTRVVLVRFISFIYVVAFTVAFNQNKDLIGRNGLKPANKYMEKIHQSYFTKEFDSDFINNFYLFMKIPTLFWFFDWSNNIDLLLDATAILGLVISIFNIVIGASNFFLMLILWLLYHSIVNVGQTWYSFGWESQLLESGFIALFLVPFFSLKLISAKSPVSFITIILYRWLIVRIMLGAGLIKIRGDKCWRDFTCMNYHYETQPVPNPISYYMHKEPELMHKFEVLSNHFIELFAPTLILIPVRWCRLTGGIIQIIFQVVLIISGNLSFLNWLTILPSLACFDDYFLSSLFNRKRGSTLWNLLKIQYLKNIKDSQINEELRTKFYILKRYYKTILDIILFTLVGYLSYPVIANLISSNQAMNTSFEPFRLVNTYGAFGSVTKERYEVIFKGTNCENPNDKSINCKWLEYEFNCKPGSVKRRPCVISPYHYRLDWLMWFAAFQSYEYNPWLLSLSAKFLLNDRNFTSRMISKNPFEKTGPPRFVKADLYRYKFTELGSNASGWWNRKYSRSYLPPITLNHIRDYLKDLGWDSLKNI